MGAILIDYEKLLRNGSDRMTPVFRRFLPKWFGCGIWDDNALREFKIHEEWNGRLYTKMFLGRMLRNCVEKKRNKDSCEMVDEMQWTKPFILVDIIENRFGNCGNKKCIRVQETPTSNNGGASKRLRIWDLIIFPECVELAKQMVKREGVKKTVCIWNACIDRYPKPWAESKVQEIVGEIVLKPKDEHDPVLSVIIFHHEETSVLRVRPFETPEFETKVDLKLYNNGVDYFECASAKYYHNEQVNDVTKGDPETQENATNCEDVESCFGIPTDDDEEAVSCSRHEENIIIYETDTESGTASVNLLEEVDTEIRAFARKIIANNGVVRSVYKL